MAKVSRRGFLLGAAAAGATLAMGHAVPTAGEQVRSVAARPLVAPRRVVRLHSSAATSWNYTTGWYGDYVIQSVVDSMTDEGLVHLTRAATVTQAWQAILPAYTAGQKIAIKINLNNSACNDTGNVIDALPQPINSVIRGLKLIGVAESDISVYDVSNGGHYNGQNWRIAGIPTRLLNKLRALYPKRSVSRRCKRLLVTVHYDLRL